MTGLTDSITHFVSGAAPVPEAAARVVRSGFIDTVAAMIAGKSKPVVGTVRQFVAARRSASASIYVYSKLTGKRAGWSPPRRRLAPFALPRHSPSLQ